MVSAKHQHEAAIGLNSDLMFGLPWWLSSKESACNAGAVGDKGSIPGSGRSPGEGHGNPLQYFLPGESHGQRSLVGCSPWGCEQSDTTEQLDFHFLLSCTGERNGSPLQCSCLEDPRDGGAWWAAIYGVTQSRTRLKQLSSSSSSSKEAVRIMYHDMKSY